MADIKGANIAKLVTKQAGRAKEKLLQNLGKADKTTDEIFEEHYLNFNIQQANANRLQKDISNYIRCIKAMQAASKNLMDSIAEVYEPQWPGQDLLTVQGQNSEMLWADLAHKLSDQVLIPLNTYQGQFPEMRKKIEKRGRKLIDFDKERHNVQTLQGNPNRNEAKYARGKESMENAKRTYEILNSELHDELPALFDSRVLFMVTNMQTVFAAEEVFHSETAKVYSEMEAIIDKLAKDVQKGTLPKRAPLPKPQPQQINSASSLNSPPKATNGTSSPSRHFGSSFGSHRADYEPVGPGGGPTPAAASNGNGTRYPPNTTTGANQGGEMYDVPVGEKKYGLGTYGRSLSQSLKSSFKGHGEHSRRNSNQSLNRISFKDEQNGQNNSHRNSSLTNINAMSFKEKYEEQFQIGKFRKHSPNNSTLNLNRPISYAGENDTYGEKQSRRNSSNQNLLTVPTAVKGENDCTMQKKFLHVLSDKKKGATTENLPPGVLYLVKASYKYQAEDVDELAFEVGEVINVVEYEDPEDQEEGWLMGYKESNGQKGMFPANFTRPI